MGLNHPRYSLFVKKNRTLRWGARFFLCGREAVTVKDGVGLRRRNNELHELTNSFLGGLCRVSPVPSWECTRGPFAAMFGKKRNRIWKFRVSKCDFFLGCRGDAGVALFLLFPSEREAERAQEFVARHETVVEREGRFGPVCPEVERVVDFWRRHEVAPFSAYLLLLFVDAFGELLPLAVDLFEGIFFSSCHKSVLLFVVVVILRVLFEEEACDEVGQRLHDERASEGVEQRSQHDAARSDDGAGPVQAADMRRHSQR